MTQNKMHYGLYLLVTLCLCAAGSMLFLKLGKKSADSQLSAQADQSLYLIGQMLAQRTENLNLNEAEVEAVARGFKDGAKAKKSRVPQEEAQLLQVQQFIDQRMLVSANKEKEKGKAYLDQFVASGAKTTPSGIAYKVIVPGSAVKPKPTDLVEVHYHGTLTDGTVFDSSEDRKEKAVFPLNQVIKGWTEGLQLIGEGGEIELVIPSDLAYGDAGSAGRIPAGATLIFKIRLFKIKSTS